MNTYSNMKIVIAGGKKSKGDLLNMCDVFLMNSRITQPEYEDLLARIEDKYPEA